MYEQTISYSGPIIALFKEIIVYLTFISLICHWWRHGFPLYHVGLDMKHRICGEKY